MNTSKILRIGKAVTILLAILLLTIFRWKEIKKQNKPFCKDCNVILIVLDTLRADRLPCYGYEKNTSPNLCAFADQSILFENHYVTSSHSLPSQTSLFTSLLPSQHGMRVPLKDRLSEQITTLAEVLQVNGYSTFWNAPLNSEHLPIDKGLERGFENFEAEDAYYPFQAWKRTIDKSLEKSNNSFLFLHTYKIHEPYTPIDKTSINRFTGGIKNEFFMTNDEFRKRYHENLAELAPQIRELIDPETLKEHQDIFNSPRQNPEAFHAIVINYLNQHKTNEKVYYGLESIKYMAIDKTRWHEFGISSPLEITPKQLSNLVSPLYDALIFELDTEIRQLFDYLEKKGMIDNSLIVIFSDHGEVFNEHGEGIGHGISLYQGIIKTPLIIHFPGNKPTRIKQNVSSLDIFPTILDAVGITIPEQAEGLSLLPLVQGETSQLESKPIISERIPNDRNESLNEAIIIDEWKLITNYEKPRENKEMTISEELYNLKTDPQEQNNLIHLRPEIAQQLRDALKRHKEQRKRFNIPKSEFPEWIDEDTRKKLIETGYF